jgi:RND family efflux transporter MFP subunit
MKAAHIPIAIILAFLFAGISGKSQADPPPMLVAVGEVRQGKSEQTAGFVGTVHFARVSRVAAEVGGVVKKVNFAEGQSVKMGMPLVHLDTDLLETEIKEIRAAIDQNQIELDLAARNFERISTLFREQSVSEREWDTYEAQQRKLEKQAAVLEARLEKLMLEQKRKIIVAPFDGVVVEKRVEKGEWVAAGGSIGIIADDSAFDALVDVPAELRSFLDPGHKVAVLVGRRTYEGEFVTFLPRGDVATRTFTTKFRLKEPGNLAEGMAARVQLPIAAATEGLLVPRDAVVRRQGKDVVFIVEEGKARLIPVEITGYIGLLAGVAGEGIEVGQQIVIKGNERVRDNQAVHFSN